MRAALDHEKRPQLFRQNSEEAMNYACLIHNEENEVGRLNERLATAETLLAAEALPLSSKDECLHADYSEEAIPERDPAYCMPDGTVYQAQTVEAMPAEVRLALARCLEQ